VLGQLFSEALAIARYQPRWYFVMPMDETLAVVAIDLSGRPALVYDDKVRVRLVATCKPNWFKISSTASSCMPVRTCTQK